jgi:hypothetical protein
VILGTYASHVSVTVPSSGGPDRHADEA